MYSFLKKNIKSIFPKRFLVKNELFFRYFFGLFYLGSSKKCVVCSKHLKSFAFYRGFEQIYEKEVALSIEESLQKVGMSEDLLEIKVIDSNPANNPQPPK